jgi:hypothetical protein
LPSSCCILYSLVVYYYYDYHYLGRAQRRTWLLLCIKPRRVWSLWLRYPSPERPVSGFDILVHFHFPLNQKGKKLSKIFRVVIVHSGGGGESSLASPLAWMQTHVR